MKSKYTLILFLLLNSTVFSQKYEETYFRNILFSFKAGYHTGFNLNYDRGFPDGLVLDGSIALGISKNIILGINFESWKKDNVVTHTYITNTELTKNYSGFGYRVFFQFRKTFFKIINLYADLGLGRYRISYNFYYDNSFSADDNYYLNGGVSVGAGIKVNKFLVISAEYSFYGLMPIFEEKRAVSTTNFKFGPTFFIQLK